jgi:hypothetical protein
MKRGRTNIRMVLCPMVKETQSLYVKVYTRFSCTGITNETGLFTYLQFILRRSFSNYDYTASN